MVDSELSRLESAIGQLTFTEQVWLMDRLAQKIRDRSARVSECARRPPRGHGRQIPPSNVS